LDNYFDKEKPTTFDTAVKIEKFILVGLSEDSLDELNELVKTAGAEGTDRLTQNRDRPHPATYLGKGKVEELGELISLHEATGIVCDDELSNSQIRNLSEALGVKVLDRTLIILEIFANNARTAEAQAQVELAQQRYRLSHLTGLGKSLSRLGGGIGTRGPGEKKLETDRRHIRKRIDELGAELKTMETHRNVQRSARVKSGELIISLVGYTNAGKSTLMNTLTEADVYASSKLFATLDITTRKLVLPGGANVRISDTVGFINKLPHHLVKAFRATLSELTYSDVLIHVVDSSNPEHSAQVAVVNSVLRDLKVDGKPIILALNKVDLGMELPLPKDELSSRTVELSAKTGQGLPILLSAVEDVLNTGRKLVTALIPYNNGPLLDGLRKSCEITKEEYAPEGVRVKFWANEEFDNKTKEFQE